MDYDRIILEMLDRIKTLEERLDGLEPKKAIPLQPQNSLQPEGFSGKYQALCAYLSEITEPSIQLSFEEIEKINGFPLPESAYELRAFWSNTKTHSISLAWMQAGFKTTFVDLDDMYVVFTNLNQAMKGPELEISSIWQNILKFAGQDFVTKNGITFTYQFINDYTILTSNAPMPLSKQNFAKALNMMPVGGPAGFGQKIQGPSYVFALLTDPRIMEC